MTKLTELTEWQTLKAQANALGHEQMRHWFLNDQQRFSKFTLQTGGILLDYSRNRITSDTIQQLCQLAKATCLGEKIAALFNGEIVNFTEKRPALHTALRDQQGRKLFVNQRNITDQIAETQVKMGKTVALVHQKKWLGITGKPIQYIVNIGIGGSHLGPKMAVHALKEYVVSNLQCHFISSIDPHHLEDILQQIDLDTTLFIISSKSFTTLETMTNAETIARIMQEKYGEQALDHHFLAVTACHEKALAFGIAPAHIFPMWDWVGGRYSIWSAIGLPLMLMIGEQHFKAFLTGGYQMDEHFRSADFSQNMPVLLALLGIWYANFFGATVQAIIPYAHRLRYFIPYLQQADMESNGKQTSLNGDFLNHASGPVIFGEEGCNGQHAYHQLLHQGQHLIPVDFILVGKSNNKRHRLREEMLIASALSQAQALMRGKTYQEAYDELMTANNSHAVASELAKHQVIPGNRPSNILFLDQLTPLNLGALIALYEHKIFVQGAIWGINSFDQWGIELGKQLLPAILQQVQNKDIDTHLDAATLGLIQHFNALKGDT